MTKFVDLQNDALYNIKRLIFITEVESVGCAVQTEPSLTYSMEQSPS